MRQILKDLDENSSVMYLNYAITILTAQNLEGALQNVLVGMEILGKVKFSRKEELRIFIGDKDEDINSACLGPMIKVLKKSKLPHEDNYTFEILEKANKSRNIVVHSLFRENAVEMLNDSGKNYINDLICKHYLIISHGYNTVSNLRKVVYEKLGLTQDMVDKRLNEIYRNSNQA